MSKLSIRRAYAAIETERRNGAEGDDRTIAILIVCDLLDYVRGDGHDITEFLAEARKAWENSDH